MLYRKSVWFYTYIYALPHRRLLVNKGIHATNTTSRNFKLCGSLKKNLKTFSCAKRHKMTFSLVFLLKMGKLHSSDYLRNKAAPLL